MEKKKPKYLKTYGISLITRIKMPNLSSVSSDHSVMNKKFNVCIPWRNTLKKWKDGSLFFVLFNKWKRDFGSTSLILFVVYKSVYGFDISFHVGSTETSL